MDESGKGFMVLVTGPSGAGKSTLLKWLVEEDPRLGFSVSCTTRTPREGEVDGRDYWFVSHEEFERRRDEGEFVEWAEVHGNYYGTSADDLNIWASTGKDVLLDIDVCGAMHIRKKYHDCMTIFILPPSLSVLEERLYSRGTDSSETIAMRLENAKKEIAACDQYDHVIVNNELDRAIDELESIIRSGRRA